MKNEPIANLKVIGEHDINTCGGKAVSLAKMIGTGINVPDGFVITTEALKKNIDTKLKRMILAEFDKHSFKNVAVRSSALVEDSKAASWAGQFDSFLNIKRSDLIKSIEQCLKATRSQRVRAYAKQNNIRLKDIELAVIIQQMVPAQAAGVAFSIHPVTTNQNQIVIEAVKGLGEALVSGTVTPDRYTVNKKNYQIVDSVLAGKQAILSKAAIVKLAKEVAHIEKLYGFAIDIEWAAESEKFYILQSRPVTKLNGSDENELHKGLVELARLLEKWGLNGKDWILTGQYVYRLFGYNISVRKGHHNVIVDKTKIPWKVNNKALEIYPPVGTKEADQYHQYIKKTGFEFDLLPFEPFEFNQELKQTKPYLLNNGQKILLQNEIGQLAILKDILSKSHDQGWGQEKGKRVLTFITELAEEFKKHGLDSLVNQHNEVAVEFSHLVNTNIIEEFSIGSNDIDRLDEYNLGKPEDLFYWGPSRAKPLYMSDFMQAAEEVFVAMHKDPLLPNPPNTLVLFHEKKMVWLNPAKSFEHFTRRAFLVYQKQNRIEDDVKMWQKTIKALDEFASAKNFPNSDPDLLKHFNKLTVNAWKLTIFAEFSLYGASDVITKQLKRFSEKDRQIIWGAYTLPHELLFMQRIDAELASVGDPSVLAKRYPWLQDGYYGKKNGILAYFEKRLEIVKDHFEPVIGLSDRRRAIAKQYGLANTEIDILNLARALARFMDERKAWMMRTRKYFTELSEHISIKGKISHSRLENSYLTDTGMQTKPATGWFYSKGIVKQVKRGTMKELWERYVDFKASSAILKGLVASGGGRHYINGEVRVITSPTDIVADDKILVVTATSPSYVPLMRKARALITDHGGMMSHAAIVARELGLPCVIGTKQATKVLKNGDKVVIDLSKGEINL
jgi:phosphoenolpyruvate synthase/pyruvate phosphate dikinase